MATSYTLNNQPLYYGPFKDSNGVSHPVDVLDRWTDQQLAAIGVVRSEIPDPIPTEVPMYKVRKFLISQNLLATVESYLNGLSEPNKSLALVDWEYAPNLVVNSALALGAKAALNLTDEQYQTMVVTANAIP